MSAVTVQQMTQRVAALLDERLLARGDGLEAKLRHSGRRLPRKVRAAAGRLAQAQARSGVPKLLLLVDEGAVARDYDICVRYLTTLNPSRGAMAAVVRVAASVAVGLLVLAVVAVGFFYAQGGV